MIRLVLTRLAAALPLLLGVVVLNFTLIQLAPGSLLDVMSAEQHVSDPAMLERLRVTYGADRPPAEQLLHYVLAVARLDLGFSYRQNAPVLDVILAHLPATLVLMLAAISIAVLVGISAGVIAASRAGTLLDGLVSALAVLVFAAPSFWLGISLVILFSVKLGWLPVGGMATLGGTGGGAWAATLDLLRHLVLPALTLGLFYAAVYARVMRASLLEVLGAEFIRNARAKGLSRRTVLLRHALRNALLPVVTLFGLQLGTVLGGSIVVETVFSWPGIGALLLDSVSSRNYPMVLGVLVMSSLVVIAANILVDLAYRRLDPRIA